MELSEHADDDEDIKHILRKVAAVMMKFRSV